MKAKPTIYWIVTVLFCTSMVWAAYACLTREPKTVAFMASLGYPDYFLNILGTAKLLGVLALLLPGCPRLKEWAYAGFTFVVLGAAWSHLASGQAGQSVAPTVFLVLLAISYCLRPSTRRLLIVDVDAVEV